MCILERSVTIINCCSDSIVECWGRGRWPPPKKRRRRKKSVLYIGLRCCGPKGPPKPYTGAGMSKVVATLYFSVTYFTWLIVQTVQLFYCFADKYKIKKIYIKKNQPLIAMLFPFLVVWVSSWVLIISNKQMEMWIYSTSASELSISIFLSLRHKSLTGRQVENWFCTVLYRFLHLLQARPGVIFSLLKFTCVGESHGRPRLDAGTP